MKAKRISILFCACILAIGSFGIKDVQTASAGQDDFIMPYYNGYVEGGGTIVSQNTVIDMSGYNGAGGVGFDSGIVTATTAYVLSVTDLGSTLCLPFAGSLNDIDEIEIKINGMSTEVERLYGEMPRYAAGIDVWSTTILDAIESVQPMSVIEGIGKVYTFETSDTSLEYSFKKDSSQTVLHSGSSWSRIGVDGYSFRWDGNTNEEYPYKIFVSDGELTDFTSNVAYSVADVTYKDFADYYLDMFITEIGEEYRPLIYSQFNRSFNGQVEDVNDVFFDFSMYSFALLKTPLPAGNVSVVVTSKVKPLVNGLYKPYIYTVRTVSAYPQTCSYTLSVIASSKLPYVLEENIGLNGMSYTGKQQVADGYFIVSSEKKPDYALDNNATESDKTWILVVGLCVGGALLFAAGLILLIGLKKSK